MVILSQLNNYQTQRYFPEKERKSQAKFFGPLLAGKWEWFSASKPEQKVGPLGGPFGPTTISKSCF